MSTNNTTLNCRTLLSVEQEMRCQPVRTVLIVISSIWSISSHTALFRAIYVHIALSGPRFMIVQTKNILNILIGVWRLVFVLVLLLEFKDTIVNVLIPAGIGMLNLSALLLFYLIFYEYLTTRYDNLQMDEICTMKKAKVSVLTGSVCTGLVHTLAFLLQSFKFDAIFIAVIVLLAITFALVILYKKMRETDVESGQTDKFCTGKLDISFSSSICC